MDRSPESIPREIWRAIIREATAPPAALIDCPERITRPERLSLKSSIDASFAIKVHLSLTSRRFHAIVDEFLFEIILVRRLKSIGPLVQLLRRKAPGISPRGWWCKLLYFHLWELGQDWDVGRYSLWGFISACPNVTDLRCSLVKYIPTANPSMLSNKYAIPEQLLQQIARSYGPSLKRLEFLGGMRIHIRHVERFLLHCPVLEVCRFNGLEPLDSLIEKYDLLAVENPNDYNHLSGVAVSERKSVVTALDWPSTSTDRISLPSLHTLDLLYYSTLRFTDHSGFTTEVGNWHLPTLRVVHTGFDSRFHSVQTRLDILLNGLASHGANLKSFSYFGGEIPIWPLVDMLVALETLEVPSHMQFANPDMKVVHQHLSLMVVNGTKEKPPNTKLSKALRKVLRLVQIGKLPTLQDVRVCNLASKESAFRSLVGGFGTLQIQVDLSMQTLPPYVGVLDTEWRWQ